MQFLHGIPHAVHAPVVPLTPRITDNVVGAHFTDDSAGRREVLDLLHLGAGFGRVF